MVVPAARSQPGGRWAVKQPGGTEGEDAGAESDLAGSENTTSVAEVSWLIKSAAMLMSLS